MSTKKIICAMFLAMIGTSRGANYGDTLDGQASKAGYAAFIADRSGQIHGRFNESSCTECHNVPVTGGSQFLRQDFVIKRAGPDGKAVTFSRYAMVRGIVTFRYPRGATPDFPKVRPVHRNIARRRWRRRSHFTAARPPTRPPPSASFHPTIKTRSCASCTHSSARAS